MGNWVIKYSHNPLKVKKLNGQQTHSSRLLALPSIMNKVLGLSKATGRQECERKEE